MDIGNSAAAAAAPGISATIPLFNSFLALQGVPIDTFKLTHYQLLLLNDQTGTLKTSTSRDGVNWKQFDTQAVAIPAAGLVSKLTVPIQGVRHLLVEFVNNATAQGAGWLPTQSLVEEDRAAQT